MHYPHHHRSQGFSLIELIVAVGLFSIVMMLIGGAYLIMIGTSRQAQGIASGINNLSFAVETMTRAIRTGVQYSCPAGVAGNSCSSQPTFQFKDSSGCFVAYGLGTGTTCGTGVSTSIGCITKTIQAGCSIAPGTSVLTDPSVNVKSLYFTAYGLNSLSAGDANQPYVRVIINAEVPVGPISPPKQFSIESSATMRGADL